LCDSIGARGCLVLEAGVYLHLRDTHANAMLEGVTQTERTVLLVTR
jgi:hypothetical protein